MVNWPSWLYSTKVTFPWHELINIYINFKMIDLCSPPNLLQTPLKDGVLWPPQSILWLEPWVDLHNSRDNHIHQKALITGGKKKALGGSQSMNKIFILMSGNVPEQSKIRGGVWVDGNFVNKVFTWGRSVIAPGYKGSWSTHTVIVSNTPREGLSCVYHRWLFFKWLIRANACRRITSPHSSSQSVANVSPRQLPAEHRCRPANT